MDNSYATQIDKYIYSDYKEGKTATLEYLSKDILINTVYLPTPVGDNEIMLARELYDLATESGIDVVFYDNGDIIKQTKGVRSQIVRRDNEKGDAHILFLCDGKSIAYSSAELCQTNIDYDLLIIGESYDKDKIYNLKDVGAKEVYISTPSLSEKILLSEGANAFVPENNKKDYEIKLGFK